MSSPFHLAFEVVEASQVGEARRAAVRVAEDNGFDDVATGRVALVATELGNNLVRHAQGGRMLVAAVADDDGRIVIELLSLDAGPGLRNVDASLADGHSTGGTSGTGLGAVRRLSDAGFDMFSSMPQGSVVLSRISAITASPAADAALRPALQAFSVGAVTTALAGETVCGDAWSIAREGRRAAVMVADGLGHGPDAATASQEAVRCFSAEPFHAPADMLDRVHARLRSTRGAAVAAVQLDLDSGELLYCGAGNIAGRLISGVSDRSLLSQHGTAGVQMRRVQVQRYEWPAHGLLVMHSDGLATRWHLEDTPGLLKHHPSTIAGWLWRQHQRGRDDATVVVIRRRES